MNGIKILFVLAIIFSCSQRGNKIEKIIVYQFPETIHSPIRISKQTTRSFDPIIINDRQKLDSIEILINGLTKFNGDYIEGSYILCSDIFYENGGKKELLFDLGEIIIDKEIFEKDLELIRLLSTSRN